LLRIAALLVVGAAGVLAVRALPEPAPYVQAPVLRVAETARGASRPVVLPDGTRVVLAPESRIRYPDAFRGAGRNVRLEGQAYFDVQSDPDRPFRIRGGDARVTVIGTAFVVRAYPGEDEVEVVVERGAVALDPDDGASPSGVLLRAGDLGRMDVRSQAPVAVRGGADARHFGWMQGRLVFQDDPVSRVLGELSRYYDIDFSAPDAVMRRRVSFEIDNQPQAAVLDLLSVVLDLEVRRQDGVVRLEPRPSGG
jgi:transmembrane sensor